MNTQNTTVINNLNNRLNRLQDNLGEALTAGTDPAEIVQQIKKLETEKREKDLKNLITHRNIERVKFLNILKLVWAVEFPAEDITTNEGYFNKTKSKKVKGLKELLEVQQYCSAVYKINPDHYQSIYVLGHTIRLNTYIYNYSQPDQIVKFDTFEAFAEHNGATLKPFTYKKVVSQKAKIEKAYKKLALELDKYRDICKKENAYSMENENFLSRINGETVSIYR